MDIYLTYVDIYFYYHYQSVCAHISSHVYCRIKFLVKIKSIVSKMI